MGLAAKMETDMVDSGDERENKPEAGITTGDGSLPKSVAHELRDEAVGRFAAGMAHALNNVFAVVLSNAQFGLREIDKNHTLYEDLSDILAAARRGVAMVDDLRSIARRQILRSANFDLNEVLRTLQLRLAQTAGDQIEVMLSPAEQEMIVAVDRERLEQAILLLVENSCYSMPHGGTLSMVTEPIDQAGDSDSRVGGVALVIRNTGDGANGDSLARLFEPYFESGRTVRPSVGPAVARGIIVQSGGRLDVSANSDGGTTYRIWLPLAEH